MIFLTACKETDSIHKGVTVFPDWWHPNASGYWAEMFDRTFNPDTGVDIDGVWYVASTNSWWSSNGR